MSGNNKWRIVLCLLTIGLSVFAVVKDEPQLGLDLRGGTQVVLDLKPRNGEQPSSELAERTLEVLRRRVDSLGVTEPNLGIAGNSRIIIDLPGVADPDQAVQVIGSTAQLTFHQVTGFAQPPPTTTSSPQASQATTGTQPGPPAGTSAQTTPTTEAGLGPTPRQDASTVLGQAAVDPNATTTPPATTVPAAPTTPAPPGSQPADQPLILPDDSGNYLQLAPSALSGDSVDTAEAIPPDQSSTSWYITLKFKSDGAAAWTRLTGQAACSPSGQATRQVAIVLDNQVISHPEVGDGVNCNEGITGTTTQITGQFTAAEARNLALLIRGGALPVDVTIASRSTLGPQLGEAAIDASVKAVVIGGILTILYIILYYRLLGVLAGLALAAYGLITYAVVLALDLTLTLPGIAAFVLSVAMAMDSNVLVYERSKEEFAAGRTLRSAGAMGFRNALSAIIDSNATTFLAALTLFFLAVGEVRGFGVTLVIGTATSIFVTLVVLRTLVSVLFSTGWASRHPKAMGMYVGQSFRRRMHDNPPDLMGLSKYFLTASLILVMLSFVGIAVKGINFGIEFSGGRLLEYHTAHPADVDAARDRIAHLNLGEVTVQRSGTEDTSIRMRELSREQLGQVDAIMRELGGGTADKLRDEIIGPSFGAELKRKATIGLIIGVGLQLAYVAFRFRWTFGIGAVVAMIMDVLVVLGIFVWLGKPFDAVFLASVLTIIAFSVNDTVVVFDRIREQRRRRGSESFARVVSDACAQTFPRTVNISLSALFILVCLLLFGGQTLSDFALALILGVITGVYSSVFIASPIAVVLERWKPALSAKTSSSSGRSGSGRSKATTARTRTAEAEPEGDESPAATTPKRPTSRPAPRPRSKSKRRR